MRLPSLFALTFSLVAVACAAETDPVGAGGETNVYEATVSADDAFPEGDDGDVGEVVGDVGDNGDLDLLGDVALVAAPENVVVRDLTSLAAATTLVSTANVNLRKGAGTSHGVLVVIPKGAVVTRLSTTVSSGYINVQFNGVKGWAFGEYFSASSSGGSSSSSAASLDGAPSPANAIARAKSAVGFSYWWGYGKWLPSGASSSNAGSCTGSCPSCSHKGSYGADCSGLVAKAWQFGTKDIATNSHPYSTADFMVDASGRWKTISRSSVKAGDALVYRSNGAGHIVVWEKGDGWGASTVYECRGCSYGCVYNTRSFGSEYKAIRRSGF